MVDIKSLISQLEASRQSKVITYITADRRSLPDGLPGFSTQISADSYYYFLNLLRRMFAANGNKKIKKLDLFYTRGAEKLMPSFP